MNNTVERKEQKRNEAKARNSRWENKPFEEQLAHLDNLFGKGNGAKKQRKKINKKLEHQKQTQKKK